MFLKRRVQVKVLLSLADDARRGRALLECAVYVLDCLLLELMKKKRRKLEMKKRVA